MKLITSHRKNFSDPNLERDPRLRTPALQSYVNNSDTNLYCLLSFLTIN